MSKQKWEKFLLTLYWNTSDIDDLAVSVCKNAQITVSWKELRRMEVEHGIELKLVRFNYI